MADRAGVLANAPLIYTLSVVRFSPLLLLSKLIPEIQHKLRDCLPEYFQMARSISPSPNMEPNSWAFLDRELKYACVLSQDHLVLQSISYLHFDEHRELFKRCLDAVVEFAGNLDVLGIGMRYVDRIEPLEGECLSQYLPVELLPLENAQIPIMKAGKVTKPAGVSTTTYHFDPEFLHIRCWRQQGMWVPEDVMELAMVFEIARQTRHTHTSQRMGQSITSVFQPTSASGALLDTDAYLPFAPTERLLTSDVVERLEGLHTMANTAFRSVATDYAFQAWSMKS
ncbi:MULTISPECIES: TIGR04255 family protein [Pseudomonas fluorescens group]|uniref:TIGR04255 family protein n=2 Tax=Pseudomonas fluorescens group TaxID=136843 RepID=A0A7Y9VU39_9PSED|nr:MULTISPECIES: TIGR04255 family protein [Pseudomonas fluorescens group]NYH08188.1 hypothetical protein [Pseudomonas moraviensis]VVP73464.1 hypothetical protein PS941_00046 [Pseudomonas fluorescens]